MLVFVRIYYFLYFWNILQLIFFKKEEASGAFNWQVLLDHISSHNRWIFTKWRSWTSEAHICLARASPPAEAEVDDMFLSVSVSKVSLWGIWTLSSWVRLIVTACLTRSQWPLWLSLRCFWKDNLSSLSKSFPSLCQSMFIIFMV